MSLTSNQTGWKKKKFGWISRMTHTSNVELNQPCSEPRTSAPTWLGLNADIHNWFRCQKTTPIDKKKVTELCTYHFISFISSSEVMGFLWFSSVVLFFLFVFMAWGANAFRRREGLFLKSLDNVQTESESVSDEKAAVTNRWDGHTGLFLTLFRECENHKTSILALIYLSSKWRLYKH